MKEKNVFVKLTFLLLVILPFTGRAQGVSITGNVQAEGQPLPGATVVIKGTTTGTTADFDGNYTLNGVSETDILVFSYIGMETAEATVGKQTVVNMTMIPSAESLDEVVVVGYGTQKKSDVTGSVASISSERLEQVPNNNFSQALQGAVPGVSIRSNSSSAEGGDVSIVIRGRNSISADNGPLIVLDGIPFSGSISDINPTDIKSIDVLKDASSTAIYGSRGANGVILITSKRGNKGQKTTINYDVFTSIDQAANVPRILTASEFFQFKNDREPGSITQSEQQLFDSGGGTNWLDEVLRAGFRQQHTLSISGGTDKTTFYISGSFLEANGIAVNDKFERASLRLNLETKVNDWFTVGSNTQLAYSDRGGLAGSFNSDRNGAYILNPLTTVRDENGDLPIFPWPEDTFYGNALEGNNVLDDDDEYKVFTNNYVQISPTFLPGLSYRLNTGVEFSGRLRGRYFGRDTRVGFETQGTAETRETFQTNVLVENILNYKKEFGKHNLYFTGLYSYQNDVIKDGQIASQGFPNDVLTYYQDNVANLIEPDRSFEKRTLLSSMLRVNYGFDGRFNATLTGRRDGYSGFGVDTKFGNFGAAGFSWNINNESFMEESVFNSLKLRLTYGVNGNQAVDPFETISRLVERSYLEGSVTSPGYIPSVLGSPDLSWESTASFNAGVDFGLWQNRLRGSLDVYTANTTDLLLERQISPINGLTEITQNVGETKNFGIDFSVFANVINKENFGWDVSGNLSYNKNEIVSVFGDDQDDVLNDLFIGQPIRVFFATEYDGVYQIGEDIANSAQPEAQPGYAKIVDQDGDGDIDPDDRVILGQRDPKVIAALNMTFRHKNLSLSLVSQGAFGATAQNTLLGDNVFSEVRRNTTLKNWWTPDNPTNDFYANDVDANILGVNFYEKTDYWRIRDVTLTYALPRDFLDSIGISALRVYFTGRNLVTITGYNGLDPELDQTDSRNVPIQKTYTIGLNLSL